MANPPAVAMTAEQLQTLLAGLQNIFVQQLQAPRPTTPASETSSTRANFIHCSSRFAGNAGENVDTFIDAISVFKSCTEMTDENALKGLPMILTGLAAEWWSGVKTSTTSFDDAVDSLRKTFGAKKPAYQIYKELFSGEQNETTKTDIFVCRSRALLAQLPETQLPESVQIDMIYSLLHRSIRKRVRRDDIASFDDLLRLARLAEETISEKKRNSETSPSNSNLRLQKERPKCSFCRKFGHSKAECRKLAATNSIERSTVSQYTSCNRRESKPPVTCYGCGAPGVIKSNCTTCQRKTTSAASSSEDAGFCSIEVDKKQEKESLRPCARPLLKIKVLNVIGTGHIDTAAQRSVASYTLYQMLQSRGQTFRNTSLIITLADGKPRHMKVLTTRVDVYIQERNIPTTFIVFPHARNNRTLLGIDFLVDAGIIVDVARKSWYFNDDPSSTYTLVMEEPPQLVQADISVVSALRADEGTFLKKEDRGKLHRVILNNKDVFSVEGVKADPSKVAAISEMPPPKNLKQLRTFLQTCSWYRKFVFNFSKIAKPLTDLTKKNAAWSWSDAQRNSFAQLKQALITAPILRQADDSLPYMIRTDASNYALGAVLLQGEGSDERPIEYASRLLTAAERNYHTTEREALAVVYAVKHFQGYIDGRQVTVETDHQALRWLMSLRSPTGRLARWALTLQEFDLKINYAPGRRNQVAAVMRDASDRRERCQDRQKSYADLKRRPALKLKMGDLVWVKTHVLSNASKGITAKFTPRRDGPYRVMRRIGNAYEVSSPGSPTIPVGKYHVSVITPYRSAGQSVPPPMMPIRKRGRPRKFLQNESWISSEDAEEFQRGSL